MNGFDFRLLLPTLAKRWVAEYRENKQTRIDGYVKTHPRPVDLDCVFARGGDRAFGRRADWPRRRAAITAAKRLHRLTRAGLAPSQIDGTRRLG